MAQIDEIVKKLTSEDFHLLSRVAHRAYGLAKRIKEAHPGIDFIEPDYVTIMLDLAILHTSRGLHLYRMLLADERSFSAAFARLEKFIDRERMTFPNGVNIGFEVGA